MNRPWTVARMAPSESSSAAAGIVARSSASAGPRASPTSPAITRRLFLPAAVARIARARVHPPEHHEIGALAQLAEGCARAATALRGEHARRGRTGQAVDRSPEPIGDRDRVALHFAGDVSGEVDEGALRIREQLRRLGDGSLERPRAATDPDFVGHPAVPEPRGAQRARPLRLGDPAALHHDGDIVAGTAAAEAGDVL